MVGGLFPTMKSWQAHWPALLLAGFIAALALAAPAPAAVTLPLASCTTGTTTFSAYLSFHPANAYDPLFATDPETGAFLGVFVPETIVLNGELIQAQARGLYGSALSGALTTCTFTNPSGSNHFVVTGILAPTIPT